MAIIINTLRLDVACKMRQPSLTAKQRDIDSRFLQIILTNNGAPISIDQGSVVAINAMRKDSSAKSFAGRVNTDGTLTLPVTAWMLELDGTVQCNVSVYTESAEKLSSLNFELDVEPTPYTGDDISEDDSFDLLVDTLAEASRAISAEEQRVQSEQSRENAEEVRATDEAQRIRAENKRIAAESLREAQEAQRVRAEEGREERIASLVREHTYRVAGLLLKERVEYASDIVLRTNVMTVIDTLTGDVSITLAEQSVEFDSEWSFTLTQGSEAHDVILPDIYWGCGIAPTFSANTATLCRLYMIGDVLCGEWVSV